MLNVFNIKFSREIKFFNWKQILIVGLYLISLNEVCAGGEKDYFLVNKSIEEQSGQINKKLILKTSIFSGVSWALHIKKWTARIGIGRKDWYLGVFSSEEEAAEEYNKAVYLLLKNENSLNKIPNKDKDKDKDKDQLQLFKKLVPNWVKEYVKELHLKIKDKIAESSINLNFLEKSKFLLENENISPIKLSGLSFNSKLQKWKVEIKVGEKVWCLGHYSSEVEAMEEYNKAIYLLLKSERKLYEVTNKDKDQLYAFKKPVIQWVIEYVIKMHENIEELKKISISSSSSRLSALAQLNEFNMQNYEISKELLKINLSNRFSVKISPNNGGNRDIVNQVSAQNQSILNPNCDNLPEDEVCAGGEIDYSPVNKVTEEKSSQINKKVGLKSSSFLGVFLNPRNSRPSNWVVKIKVDGRNWYIGSFRSEEKAAEEFNKAIYFLLKSESKLNEVPNKDKDQLYAFKKPVVQWIIDYVKNMHEKIEELRKISTSSSSSGLSALAKLKEFNMQNYEISQQLLDMNLSKRYNVKISQNNGGKQDIVNQVSTQDQSILNPNCDNLSGNEEAFFQKEFANFLGIKFADILPSKSLNDLSSKLVDHPLFNPNCDILYESEDAFFQNEFHDFHRREFIDVPPSKRLKSDSSRPAGQSPTCL